MAISLFDLTLLELEKWVRQEGQPAYRAKQIFRNLYQGNVCAVEEMTDLPADLRRRLADQFFQSPLAAVETQKSSDGTLKLLSKLSDGQFVETVLIPAQFRQTVCISTQVGCAYACAFCASGQLGLKRNLSPGEIIRQVLLVEKIIRRRVSNIVFMGMGEPLANYENLLKAIRIMNDPAGLKIGARKMTISTVGLVPMIERLSREGMQVELSISLHAPTDEIRAKLMPVNRKYPLPKLIPAAKAYCQATKRLITFEYILIHEVNDSTQQAKELAQLLKGMLCKVNLIPCHPTPGTPWGRPPLARMLAFEKILRSHRIACTLRRSRGLDIEGACGQLRLRQEEAPSLALRTSIGRSPRA